MCWSRIAAICLAWLALGAAARAGEFNIAIDGTDAIFLAGRTDLLIPPANQPWPGGLVRHPSATPEEAQETLPPTIPVSPGQTVRVVAAASGWVNFFNGGGTPNYGPGGDGAPGSSQIRSFGGISGYVGRRGALAGVFIGAGAPKSGAPGSASSGSDARTVSPGLRQVFSIGSGVTSKGELREFVVPNGATRLALGIADGFDFRGAPGFYDDNDGSYSIRLSTGP